MLFLIFLYSLHSYSEFPTPILTGIPSATKAGEMEKIWCYK